MSTWHYRWMIPTGFVLLAVGFTAWSVDREDHRGW